MLRILDKHITDSLVCLFGCVALLGIYMNSAKSIKYKPKTLTCYLFTDASRSSVLVPKIIGTIVNMINKNKSDADVCRVGCIMFNNFVDLSGIQKKNLT